MALIDAVRRDLGELAVMAQQVERAEQRILGLALSRLDEVEAAIIAADRGLVPVNILDERRCLERVIANARAVLARSDGPE
ncbi:hypothetical protein [Burkholderia multivorans]|uniref:hypothetical protein n=1 Tax=Burkholderia multivorans TaxID=87883 RepID=UPI001239787B|nr:hypothetical protein [Burkholderia multivorans]MBU9247805.1 hypothetical protein [Burkholderia multivorans]QET31709.1 hypothetical protein FOB31_18840 [Burkholderia multivorans]QET40871.1 hypothetical protein FOB30_25020 [Burkholderia multivorans]